MAVISERFDSLGLEDPSRTYKLGIMGGSFDPIHMGHLVCAEQVCESLSLDAVVFMPAGQPWMKSGRILADAEDRLAMARIATKDNPKFDVSRLELDREGLTYTVDTLRAMRSHFPDNVELHFIMGADAVRTVHMWHQADQLSGLATLVAVTRPGYDLADACAEYGRVHGTELRVVPVQVTPVDVSSTDLREKAAAGASVRYLVPQVVADYMAARGLYREAE